MNTYAYSRIPTDSFALICSRYSLTSRLREALMVPLRTVLIHSLAWGGGGWEETFVAV